MPLGDYSPIVATQRAGRIQPTQWQSPDGSWVLHIGSEDAGHDEDVVVGDYYGLKQSVDFTGLTFVTFALRMRQSTDAASVSFKASVLIDGAEIWSLEPGVGETVEYGQRTANVAHLTGAHDLEFRLEAVAP